jgi:hypothetical protein
MAPSNAQKVDASRAKIVPRAERPKFSPGSNHSHVVRVSESLGSNSTSGVSLGSVIIRQRKRLPRHLQRTRAKSMFFLSFSFFFRLYYNDVATTGQCQPRHPQRTGQTYVLFFSLGAHL